MTEVIAVLNRDNPLVTLSKECDIICTHCPNNLHGKCIHDEKVSQIDQRCLDEYGLQFGDTIHWYELKQYAYEKIIYANKLTGVCQNCEWRTLCVTDKTKRLL